MITPGHRRSLNRALHELRRPLQALVLLDDPPARPAAPPSAAGRRGLLELITTALDDLDRAVNGGEGSAGFRRFSCREQVFACLERWRHAASSSGGFRVYWDAGSAPVEGDPARLAQALDNLVANALEHGGPPLVVTGARVAGRVRITIANGSAESHGSGSVRRDGDSTDPRRGHGTDVVTEVASAHRGRFALCHAGGGSVAALELPLAEPGYARGVSRRARALAFLAAALICAILAATVAGSCRSRVEGRYGPLRPVVVSSAELPAGESLGPERARAALSIRRVPARFIPPGAIASPAEAVGRAPMATIPPGSYVLGAQLQIPDLEPPRPAGVGAGRRPVQVPVAGAEALLIGGSSPEGSRVDVVVSRQAGLGSSAHARIAASSVKLLALRGPAGPGEGWSATLAVTEEQALALIGAQAAGREIRLLPQP